MTETTVMQNGKRIPKYFIPSVPKEQSDEGLYMGIKLSDAPSMEWEDTFGESIRCSARHKQALAAALIKENKVTSLTLTDVVEPAAPNSSEAKVCCVKADLTSQDVCDSLLTKELTHVFLLHGIMSGTAEADLDLGMKVNIDATRQVFDTLRRGNPSVRVVFTSTTAVYGPPPRPGFPLTEANAPSPGSSYGAQKLISETLLNDFSRRKLLDGRIVRLPTVLVRPGKPTGAASSFASGIFREPLKGQKSILPVSKDLSVWICSPRTVVQNLIHARDIPAEKYGGGSRVVNLPGVTVSIHEMLVALKAIGGQEAVDLVEEKRDAATEKIVESWPAKYDTSRAKDLGFADDATTPLSLYNIDEDVPQSAVRNASHAPQKKRRKIARKPTEDRIDPSELQHAYLCIATIDIQLIFAAQNHVEAVSTLSSDAPRPILLQRVERIDGTGSKFLCQIATEYGDLLFDATVFGECSPQSLKVLQRITEIPRISQRKTASRVLCTITNQTSSSKTSGRSFLISAKILMPDNQELLEASISDRRLVLDLCGLDYPIERDRPWSPRDFYDNVLVPEKKTLLSSFPRIDQLKCQLYPFQQRAIEWLLYRETGRKSTKSYEKPQLPHGFIKTVDADGKPCFISPFLGTMTSDEGLLQSFSETRGGILAEEMGLGKTVEITGLICLHRHQGAFDIEHAAVASPRGCAATLIITPLSILDQWKSELQTLAPDLRTTTYEGLRTTDSDDNEAYMSRFCNHDIVLTTYNVLAREIHHSGHVPDRSFRHEKKYQRRLSPLTQLKWWRVVLDEAQMIESGVSNAAKVAQLIPRHNAWCVSGTPVKKNSQDLRGLLVFLRFPPYCYSAQLWNRLIAERRDIFRQIFGTLALRHTKEQIKDDVQLPPQRRIIITVPFTQIEEQNYLTLYKEMCEECGLDSEGNPLSEDWDPNANVERMRSWLLRLRQTCLHAEVGIRNRKALGKGKNPLRTVDEVLDVMTEQNLTTLRAEERNLLVSKARRGQILEHAKHSKEALAIWADALGESHSIVSEARSRLQAESTAVNSDAADTAGTSANNPVVANTQIGAPRQRLRSALELEHMLLFFMANAYYQIKSDEQETKPESAEFRELERLEEEYYEKAKLIRKEILVEARGKADSLINVVHAKCRERSFATIPDPKPQVDRGGIESRSVLEKLEDITQIISRQANLVEGWREKVTKLLVVPLLDQEDTDLQGDEYETSTQQQDTVYSYVDALRAIVSDYHDIITGQRNLLIEHEMKVALRQAIEGGGHSPELLRELLGIREDLKPSAGVGSIRGVITDLRELRTTFRAQLERGNVRAGAELGIISKALTAVQSLSASLSKAGSALQREVELFTDVMNARLEFYRQLQQISDTVVPYEEDADEQSIAAALFRTEQAEGRLRTKIATLKSTARYLDHIRIEALNNDVNRLCIICQQSFEIGVLTSCGHSYCAECLRLWRRHHGTCPTCKKRLDQNDLHQITFKPQEVTVQEETQSRARTDATTGSAGSPSNIYTDISTSTLNEIKSIDMDVKHSFGTKIDSIARHIIWLRENDPGSKSVVFSQFRDFLWVLGTAFSSFKIGYANIDGKKGVQRFKNDPGIECLLMHAKSSSSGLTLVNATHVFLCEPLINTAIELQAVARVHRIGQHQPTTVWVYVVEDTVEKSIYDISVERRMTHVGKPEYRKASSETGQAEEMEGQIEAANTVELEAAPLGKLLSSGTSGGEMVDKEDLWSCLFRQKPVQNRAISSTVEREVGRHLRAAAADKRQDEEEVR
ncbi:MAG: hypothetical protein Q9188_000585 [Gyalolechia gomerana]